MRQAVKVSVSLLAAFSVLTGAGGLANIAISAESADTGCEITKIPCGMVSCYLIAGKDQCVLVDTGGAKNRKKVYDAVKNRNVSLIILTHGHYDHIQNAAYLADKLHAKIAMSADDRDLIINQSAHKTYGRTVIQKAFCYLAEHMNPSIKIDPFEPDLLLTDGQSLADFGIDGTIMKLEGHTKGSVAVVLNGGKDIIAGDTIMNFITLTEPFLFESYDALQNSMTKLKNSGAVLYPGHGQKYIP